MPKFVYAFVARQDASKQSRTSGIGNAEEGGPVGPRIG